MSAADQALEERIEIPSIPSELQKKIAHLQEEYARAEVVQSEFSSYPSFRLNCLSLAGTACLQFG